MCVQCCTVERLEVCYCVSEKCDVYCVILVMDLKFICHYLNYKIISDDLEKKTLIRSIVPLVTLERRPMNTLVHQYAHERFSERGSPFASLSD
jgi:hypothetical protein